MTSTFLRTVLTNPRGELALLFLASCSVVAVMLVAVAMGGPAWFAGEKLRLLLLSAAAVGLVAAGVALLGLPDINLARPDRKAEVHTLRQALQATEAVIHAEPQILVFWERGERVRVMSHTLTSVPGVPRDAGSLERFGNWLEPTSAEELKTGLDALFAEGRAFNMLLRTIGGAHLEADGRTAGGRALLRLRDVVGYRRDLARLLDQHRELTRECRAGRALFDSLPMPVWFRDADGRLAWVNQAYLKAVEVESVDTVKQKQVELLEARQRERATTALAGGQPFRDRLPLVAAGQMKAHDVVVLPLDSASAGAAIDAAAIENVQGELDRQVAAYDRTLHRVATGIAIFGPDRRLAFFNEAYRNIWQLDADWLSTRPSDAEILDRLRGLSRLPQVVNFRDWKARVLAAPRLGEFEEWWHLLDGRTIHVMAELRPDGGVTFLFDDATERIGLEARYNQLIEAQRETLDSLKEGVAVFAPDGRLRLFNAAFTQVWKLSRAMLAEGPHIDAITRQCAVLHPDTEQWTGINHAVTNIADRRAGLEGRMQRPDASVIDYTVMPLPDGATLITFADVTDAKRYERALIERNDALVAADRLKSQFISHVSYELRTPLTNIIGFSEFMTSPRVGPLNEKQREYIGDITASSKSLLAVINDILDLATIDAGGLELKVAPVAVRPIVDAALLGVKERAQRKRLAFDLRIDDAVHTIVADESRIRQVLYNLLSNAIGFSSAGETIRVGCWREAGMIAFAIEDQGPGIPRDQQAKVFERFETRTQGSAHRGAGLGLAIVKSLVELHGGNLTLDSEPGRGTRVTVRLPETGIGADAAVARVA